MFKSLFWPAKVFSRSCDISSSETSPSSLTFGALISCQSIENDWDAFNSLKILFFIERKSKAKTLGRDTWKLMIEMLDTVDRYIFKKWNVTFVYFLVLNWREIYLFSFGTWAIYFSTLDNSSFFFLLFLRYYFQFPVKGSEYFELTMADFVAAVALNSNVPEECPSLMDLCIQVWLYKDPCYSSHSAKSIIVSLSNLIYLALS